MKKRGRVSGPGFKILIRKTTIFGLKKLYKIKRVSGRGMFKV